MGSPGAAIPGYTGPSDGIGASYSLGVEGLGSTRASMGPAEGAGTGASGEATTGYRGASTSPGASDSISTSSSPGAANADTLGKSMGPGAVSVTVSMELQENTKDASKLDGISTSKLLTMTEKSVTATEKPTESATGKPIYGS